MTHPGRGKTGSRSPASGKGPQGRKSADRKPSGGKPAGSKATAGKPAGGKSTGGKPAGLKKMTASSKPEGHTPSRLAETPPHALPEALPATEAGQILRPEILSPAGNMASALAAFAAGADAVYLGLKHFSARMQAENFSIAELAKLCGLAKEDGKKVYIALNTLIKPGDIGAAMRLIRRLELGVNPDALIVQDLGILELARAADFSGGIFLSTLANLTHPNTLPVARALGADRVILPRELSIDEIRAMDEARPQGLGFEVFVHGALCYCVSGRCWWSSYMGGKSGLRGRCVQPCRRLYTQKGREGRFFSCLDLSLGAYTRGLLSIPGVQSWKIEGRKKGPHYVYHVTRAYTLLRDFPDSKEARAEAESLLALSLGRPGTTALFLPQKSESPNAGPAHRPKDAQTSSGLLLGRVVRDEKGGFSVTPGTALLPKDLLRVGYEDEPWHATLPVASYAPEGRAHTLKMPPRKVPKPGTPVFLIDRKSPDIQRAVSASEKGLARQRVKNTEEDGALAMKVPSFARMAKAELGLERPARLHVTVRGSLPRGREAKAQISPGNVQGLWLSPRAVREISQTLFARISWWLPPVIWPDEEALWIRLIHSALARGARHFVCNEPWQRSFFAAGDRRFGKSRASQAETGRAEQAGKTGPGQHGQAAGRYGLPPLERGLSLTAGPFCNTANAAALYVLAHMGYSAAVVCPELGEAGFLSLPRQSPLPLGAVVGGYWPMGITRNSAKPLKTQETFASPKGEEFWFRQYGENLWLYPAWPLDLSAQIPALEKAGYSLFVTLEDYPPKTANQAKRPGEFNWNVDLL